jgi:hypothetical protein
MDEERRASMSIRKRHLPLRIVITLVLLGVVSSALVQIEPKAGTWKTHVLTSGSEVRLPPPPDPSAPQAELAELRVLAAQRDAAGRDQISYGDAGWPGYRWTELGMS